MIEAGSSGDKVIVQETIAENGDIVSRWLKMMASLTLLQRRIVMASTWEQYNGTNLPRQCVLGKIVGLFREM